MATATIVLSHKNGMETLITVKNVLNLTTNVGVLEYSFSDEENEYARTSVAIPKGRWSHAAVVE